MDPQGSAGGDPWAGRSRRRHEDEALEYWQIWVSIIKDKCLLQIINIIFNSNCSRASKNRLAPPKVPYYRKTSSIGSLSEGESDLESMFR